MTSIGFKSQLELTKKNIVDDHVISLTWSALYFLSAPISLRPHI